MVVVGMMVRCKALKVIAGVGIADLLTLILVNLIKKNSETLILNY